MGAANDYRPDLDGVRAIAVLAVVLYHLELPLFSGGFVGVDIFFVLSGYFVTRQILESLERGDFTVIGFYERRIRRLFPALFLVLTVSACAAWLTLLPDELDRFGVELIAAVVSLSNFLFWRRSDYFGPDAEQMPLLHTWSLAVEEQFYIVLPIALLLLVRFGWSCRSLGLAIAAAAALSFAASVMLLPVEQATVFYLLPTRFWELAIGSVLATPLVPIPRGQLTRQLMSASGLVMILAPVFVYSAVTPFPGLAALPPCLGCALLIQSGRPTGANARRPITVATRVLSFRPMVFIGLVSYSFYLWHWPLIVFAKHSLETPLGLLQVAAVFVAAFALAVLSWRFVEQPFRRGQVLSTRARRFMAAGIGGLAIAGFGAAAAATNGFPERIPDEIRRLSEQAQDFSPLRRACHANGRGNLAFDDTCVFGPAEAPRVVLAADSHGAELSYALAGIARSGAIHFRQITGSSCPPALGFAPPSRPGCPRHVEIMLRGLQSEAPANLLITAYYFNWHANPATRDQFWGGLDRFVGLMRKAGHSVVLLGGVPPHGSASLPETLAKNLLRGTQPSGYQFPVDRNLATEIDGRLQRLADRHAATFLPIAAIACSQEPMQTGRCSAFAHGHALYFDKHHLTNMVAGRIVARLILPQLGVAAASANTTSNP